jgi:DNA processing protein
MSLTMDDYVTVTAPPRLRRLKETPDELWVAGNPDVLNQPCVAVVGARACSVYGRAMARKLGRELAREGITVLSGFARGVDTEAHRGALDMRGNTVAVFGCGIDHFYPNANRLLGIEIADSGGLLLSEYEPGVPPAPWRFPARNRIIAGLADAVVLVESRERSGGLITVDFAREFGRPVLAVPGELGAALSIGTNRLIHDGHARMYTDLDDVLSALDTAQEGEDL